MNLLIKTKIKKQKDAGFTISSKTAPKLGKTAEEKTKSLKNVVGGVKSKNELNGIVKAADGYWVVLQDWTQCSLKCGGGDQTLHLMCMPPKAGGKPCGGEAIRKRPCNSQPCPKPTGSSSIPGMSTLVGNGKQPKMEKPIIKVMPISNKPQRFDKCYLKETDVFVVLNTSNGPVGVGDMIANNPKIPVRIVMNNKSVAFYKDESLKTNIMSLSLETTEFVRINKNNSCFLLQGKSGSSRIIVCSMDSNGKNFIEEWDYDYSLFKNQCNEKRPVIKSKDSGEIQKKYKEKLNAIKEEIIQEKHQKARKESAKSEELTIKKKVDQTQAMTVLAIQKEIKLEQMLEKEEIAKENDEQEELVVQLKNEKKKNEVLMNSIKEKQLEDQYNISKENAENAIKKLKEEAKNTIMKKRNEIKNKITQMRQKNERKKAAIKSKIISMRTETAEKLNKFSKKGDIERCFIPNPNPKSNADQKILANKPYKDQISQIEIVCAASFSTNVAKFMECKTPESYCYICCETEFGEMHLVDREKCYNKKCGKF